MTRALAVSFDAGRGYLRAIKTTNGREQVTDEFEAHTPWGLWTTKTGKQVLFNRNDKPIWQMDGGVVTRAGGGRPDDIVTETIYFDAYTKLEDRVRVAEGILLLWAVFEWQSALFTPYGAAPVCVRECAAEPQIEKSGTEALLASVIGYYDPLPAGPPAYITAGWEVCN